MATLSCHIKLFFNVTMYKKNIKIVKISSTCLKLLFLLIVLFAENCLIIYVDYLLWIGMEKGSCIVCSRFFFQW
jgi:hypothetical protein